MKDEVGKAIMKIKSAEQIANTFSAAQKKEFSVYQGTDCLSIPEGIRYVKGEITQEEHELFRSHIRTCLYCYRRTENLRRMKKYPEKIDLELSKLPDLENTFEEIEVTSEKHLSTKQIMNYIDDRLTGVDTDIDSSHIMVCDLCKNELRRLTEEIYRNMLAVGSIFYTILTRRIMVAIPGKYGDSWGRRYIYDNEAFRGEIYKKGDTLFLSLAAKLEMMETIIGKFVSVSIPSANNVHLDAEKIVWEQEGPKRIVSKKTISSGGRIEIEIAKTILDIGNDDDFNLLEQVFEEIKLELFNPEN